jgi:formate-dependent phosphoribosylglycinamide formyltransferase (GAR transformylase)
MKKILIIGASWEQEPLIKKAREKGLYVIVTNYRVSQEFQLAHDSYVVEPRNLIRLDEIFQKTKPDAVIADECDYSMFAVAWLTNKYHLPGPKMDSLMITNNKYLERRYAERAGLPQPEFRLCMTFDEVTEAINQFGYPVMLKPLDNRGSIGVFRVNSAYFLKELFLRTLASSHSRQMLVEKIIPGEVVIVEGLYTDRFYNLSFATKKMHPRYPDNAMYLQYPGNLPDDTVQKLYNLNTRLIETIGIDYGNTHTEFMVSGNEINFLEIANRGGGVGLSNRCIPYVTGVDVSDVLIRSALGETVKIGKFANNGFAIESIFDFGIGRVTNIENVDEAERIDGVLNLWINFRIGDYLPDIATAINRHGSVIVGGTTVNKCLSIINKVEKLLKVTLIEMEN